MILGQRIRLDLNNVQETWMRRCAGTSRFVWNWGLARWQAQYKAGERPSWMNLNKEFNSIKATQFPWVCDLPCDITNKSLSDLGQTFQNFFRRVKQGSKPGYPRFKSKKRAPLAFGLDARQIRFDGRKVRLPKLGWVRIRQEPRFPGKICTVRLTHKVGHWYLSIQVEVPLMGESKWSYPHPCETQAVVGIDLGLRDLAVLSDGTRVKAPRVLRAYEKKLRRLNKELSRRTKGGKNRNKTKLKLGKIHERIANIRSDATHKLTARIVRDFRWIGIEDLNVVGMAQGLRLAKSVMDAAMAEVRRQLEYKASLSGSTVIVADRWFPSSKTCSACGVVYKDLVLDERRWVCESCRAEHDRDENAAENLKKMAAAYAVTACCQGSSVPLRGEKLPPSGDGQEEGLVVNFG